MSGNERQILKMNEWQSASGKWYVADTQMFSGWWEPARLLGLHLEDYILMLINQYHANIISFTQYEDKRNSLLQFNFDKFTDAHQFMLDINRIARNKKYFVYRRAE